MARCLVGDLHIHLNDYEAVDYSTKEPKGGGLSLGVDSMSIERVTDEKVYQEGLYGSLEDEAPEGQQVEECVLLAHMLIVDRRISKEVFSARFLVKKGKPYDWHAGKDEIVDLVLPLLVEGLA